MNSEEKDQGKPRILLVTTRPIDRTGGAHQRVQGIISALKQCYEVKAFVISDVLTTLLPDGAAFQGDRRGRLFSVTPRWVRHEVSTQQRATIIKCLIAEIEAFDASLVIFSGPGTLPWLTRLEGIPTILDAYDLMWVGIKRKDSRRAIRLKSRLRAKIEEIIARRYERRKYALVDEVWVCSETDMDYVQDNHWRGYLRVVPNFFATPESGRILAPQRPCNNTLLFVGLMAYHPNLDGIKWFLTHCWQLIRNQIPDARLKIAGPGSETTELSDLLRDGVEILGFVEDLSPLWQAADVFICPLHLGTGTRIKIIEAWSRGLPVVSTSIGIEGLAAIPSVHALVADDPQTFADSVVRLLQDTLLRTQIGSEGHKLMQSLYTLDRIGALAVRYCWEMLEQRNIS